MQTKKVAKKVKLHVKSGDTVKVISGNSKGKTGQVLSVDVEKQRVLVQGVNLVKRHTKPNAQDPQSGGIIEKEATIHVSNLMVVEPATGQPTKIGYKLNGEGKLQRFSKQSGNFIPDPYQRKSEKQA